MSRLMPKKNDSLLISFLQPVQNKEKNNKTRCSSVAIRGEDNAFATTKWIREQAPYQS